MASMNLYPPIVNDYEPAILAKNDSVLKVYFSLSKLNSDDVEINSAHFTIVKQGSGVNLINKGVREITITKNEKEIKIKRYNSTGITLNVPIEKVEEEENLYYIEIYSEDLVNGWEPGCIYKIQMRLSEVKYIMEENGEKLETQSQWLTNNASRFSEWSTICTVKSIGNLFIHIPKFDFDFNTSSPSSEVSLGQYDDFSFIGSFKGEDPLYSFQVILEDENTIIEDSGILYTNRYESSRFEYIFKTQPKNEKFYTLTIRYETVNKYSFETKFQLRGLVNILENGININTIDSNINMANITSISQEEEEGRVCLQISGNAETPISLKVRRTDSRTNFSQWEDINTIKNYVSEYTFYDYTIESGVWYKYGVQIEQSDGIRSVLNIIDKPIIRNFNYTFLLGENNQQLKLQFNNTFDSYKININESITNTLGGVFPLVSRSGATYYKTFSLGGLISFNMDENKLFLSDDEIYNFNEVAELYKEYNLKNNITHYDYNLEREFRNKVITFLNDGKIKLLKSPTEGNILIYLSGVSFSPENSLSRMIYSFSSTATEIARSNIESYKKYKIIKVEED